MHTYPNTRIADPSTMVTSPASREERRADFDAFTLREHIGEQLLLRPIKHQVFKSKVGNVPNVCTDVLVLTGPRKGKAFSNAAVFPSTVVGTLDAVLSNPFVTVVAGVLRGGSASRVVDRLDSLPDAASVAHAESQARALRWDEGTPATEEEMLGWNLREARVADTLDIDVASAAMRMDIAELEAIERGESTVTALQLRDFSRVYRTTMARLLP